MSKESCKAVCKDVTPGKGNSGRIREKVTPDGKRVLSVQGSSFSLFVNTSRSGEDDLAELTPEQQKRWLGLPTPLGGGGRLHRAAARPLSAPTLPKKIREAFEVAAAAGNLVGSAIFNWETKAAERMWQKAGEEVEDMWQDEPNTRKA